MKKSNLSIKEVEQAIQSFGLLKAAESSFSFWDNPEDQVYDNLGKVESEDRQCPQN